jgi:hypothetical protein
MPADTELAGAANLWKVAKAMASTKTTRTIAPTKCDRALFPGPVIAGVA